MPPEPEVNVEIEQPQTAMVEGGDWLVVSVVKMWIDRKGRRGVIDPSGGLSAAPAYSTEILLAVPLVDEPKTPNPPGTLTPEQFKDRVIGTLVSLNEQIVNVDEKPKQDF